MKGEWGGTAKCRVIGCKKVAETTREPLMNKHGAEVPVCRFHLSRKSWWYRDGVYDHTEG